MVTTRPPKTIVKPTALGPVANTDTKLLIYGLFRKGRVLAQDGIESVCAPPIAEHPWPNHGGGQRWSLTRSPLRRTVPPLMLRVPIIMMMKDTQPIHRWVLPQSSVGGRRVTCSRARVLA